ncbi:MAG TPA: methyltransferase domain-containing protein [Acidimicrobiales bacterium]|nr:methyltransferase domain-containing protein [Acidimicrobiales bacterium]
MPPDRPPPDAPPPAAPPPAAGGYLLGGDLPATRRRLDALRALFDPWTLWHLAERGVGTGWRCWEVGAGGTSVVEWLAARVGAGGRVLATDIDTAALAAAATGPVEVRRHDVVADAPPDEVFDLVHARLVLVHLADRSAALATMADVLAPGGWLVVEDADPALQPLACLDDTGADAALANRVRAGFRTLLAARGVDLAFGRTLPRRLRSLGLLDVGADAYVALSHPACAPLERATIEMIRPQLVDNGIAGDAEIDRLLAAVDAGRVELVQPPLVTAWGRRAR